MSTAERVLPDQPELAAVITSTWLEATDAFALTDEESDLVELGYRLGFVNAIQRIWRAIGTGEDERMAIVIQQAIELAGEEDQ